jgi:hypothetical protein
MGGGKIKTREELTVTAFFTQHASTGWQRRALMCLANRGKAAGIADRIAISLKKEAVRKSFEWWGENKKDRKTHHHPPLHSTCKHAMAAAGSYLTC